MLSGEYTNIIIENLTILSRKIELKGILGLFDDNRYAQNFFKTLFNLTWGYELENLDLKYKVNFPAVDLGDENCKISFQITSDSGSDKIHETIKKFDENKLNEKFERLVVFIIGKKEKYKATTVFKSETIQFNKDTDILDNEDFIRHISTLNTSQLEEISKFVETELAFLRLVHPEPNKLHPQDIRALLRIIKDGLEKYLGELNDVSKDLQTIIDRGDDFIVRKNRENQISSNYFKSNIQKDLKHNSDINDFISNPINKEWQQTYLNICETIQKHYENNPGKYSSFAQIFIELFDNIDVKFTDKTIEKEKILTVLHNMYFNCDIGVVPVTA